MNNFCNFNAYVSHWFNHTIYMLATRIFFFLEFNVKNGYTLKICIPSNIIIKRLIAIIAVCGDDAFKERLTTEWKHNGRKNINKISIFIYETRVLISVSNVIVNAHRGIAWWGKSGHLETRNRGLTWSPKPSDLDDPANFHTLIQDCTVFSKLSSLML